MRWSLCAVVGLAVAVTSAGGDALESAREYRTRHAARILRDFTELLALPNTSHDLPALRKNAEWIRAGLARRGVEATLLELPGVPPLVHGFLAVEGAERTLGIYLHYDGQPVDPAQWTHAPFEPTLYDRSMEQGGQPIAFPSVGEPVDPAWYLYARSAGDDKAPLQALFTALDALGEARIAPTSNLLFLFEGEEEAGSDHLGRYLEIHRDRLEADLWLICDGPVHQSRRSQLVFGVRGYTGVDITVYGATRYLHSGHYGNWAPNPALELSRLLAGMKDAEGRVTIKGFYDSVTPLSAAEKQALADLPDVDTALRAELGLAATEGGGASLAQRLTLPSLNIRGLHSATVGPTARNLIPTQAEASLDIRLVKGNDPAKMLDLVEAHIRSAGYHIVRDEPAKSERMRHARIARVIRREGYPAARSPMDSEHARTLIEAGRRASGEAPLLVPALGGSLPLHLFTERLARPIVIVPIANHDDNQHAPDENLRLANLWYGIDLFSTVLTMP